MLLLRCHAQCCPCGPSAAPEVIAIFAGRMAIGRSTLCRDRPLTKQMCHKKRLWDKRRAALTTVAIGVAWPSAILNDQLKRRAHSAPSPLDPGMRHKTNDKYHIRDGWRKWCAFR